MFKNIKIFLIFFVKIEIVLLKNVSNQYLKMFHTIIAYYVLIYCNILFINNSILLRKMYNVDFIYSILIFIIKPHFNVIIQNALTKFKIQFQANFKSLFQWIIIDEFNISYFK